MKAFLTGLKIYGFVENYSIDRSKIFIETEFPEIAKVNFEIDVVGDKEHVLKMSEILADEAVNFCNDFVEFYKRKKVDVLKEEMKKDGVDDVER